MKLQDFIGNESIKEQLMAIFQKNRFPHAIILQGENGTGKGTLADIIANAAVCSGSSFKPCGVCRNCIKFEANVHPDVIHPEILGASKVFKVETIREIKDKACIMPNEASFKVYILKSAEKMTKQAQNAFLKVLEEPPNHVIFILTCISVASLLPTVRSRCQVFSLKPASENQAADFLSRNYNNCQTSRLAHGNIGLAISLINNADFDETHNLAQNIARAMAEVKNWGLLAAIGAAAKDRLVFLSVLELLESIIYDAYMLNYKNSTNAAEIPRILASEVNNEKLLACTEIIKEAKKYLSQNTGVNLVAMTLCSKFSNVIFEEFYNAENSWSKAKAKR